MVIQYPKGMYARLSDHIYLPDLECKCVRPDCRVTYVDEDLVSSLEEAWVKSGGFWINRAFSCTAHNAEIGGKPGSFHLSGKAADISPKKITIPEFLVIVQNIPRFRDGGIGVYRTWIHADVRGYRARWTG